MTYTATIPSDSLISAHAAEAGFRHCRAISLAQPAQPAMALFLRLMAGMPGWIDALMVLRNRLVALVGLKDLGRLTAIDPARPAASYQPGERVGISPCWPIPRTKCCWLTATATWMCTLR